MAARDIGHRALDLARARRDLVVGGNPRVVDVRASPVAYRPDGTYTRNDLVLLDHADQTAKRIVRVLRPEVEDVLGVEANPDVDEQTVADGRRPAGGPGAQS